jgi:UDP-glucose 4-epimerase
LAVGHIAALNKLPSNAGIKVYNLGTGRGYSVLEAVKEFEKASGKEVKYVIGPRRPGDLANVVADAQLSEKVKSHDFMRKLTKISSFFLDLFNLFFFSIQFQELGWKATRGLPEMCNDLWRWQDQNPYGFRKKEDAK